MLSNYRIPNRIVFFTAALTLVFFPNIHAALAITRVDELRDSIASKQTDIQALRNEIKILDTKLKETGEVSKSLAGAIQSLELTSKKLAANIKITEGSIALANLQLERLGAQIGHASGKITSDHASLAEIIRLISREEGDSLIESSLGGETLSAAWTRAEALSGLEGSLHEKVTKLVELKSDLEDNKAETQAEQTSLVTLQVKLAQEKKVADQNRVQQAKLLADTKNKESGYKKLLAEKEAKEAQFERELSDFEAKLSYEIDQSRLPSPGNSVLVWPLDTVRITQYFGNTSFSQTHAAVYNGKGHNGVDFGVSFGTPVRAARLGTVAGTGDTDLTCSGASYGKWIFIRHDNGLSTLYAHLSIVNVREGDSVGTGDVIGYSGNTGYSTGPHLHFTVIATQGSQVGSLRSKNPACGTYRLPLAALNGYLNPLEYLPK